MDQSAKEFGKKYGLSDAAAQRIYFALRNRYVFDPIEDMTRATTLTDQELLWLPNFGPKTLAEFRRVWRTPAS